ncbi:MAG: TlyA family rRNA (cytidine-2-O)-methyltransferase, partial [Caulobacteraceae bacterium]|nr:TlyA family rRNA (cytidine-2-O)-methyltransferase [Caulobacteraceae bacterium]
MKTRADVLLVQRGLFASRARAREAIEAGLAQANGAPIAKPSELIEDDAALVAQPAHPWVVR